MDKQTELKPCPFCGGNAKIVEGYDCLLGETVYYIECCDCKATFLDGNDNRENEIKKWNRRV